MKISLTWPALPNTLYGEHGFDSNIGKTINLTVADMVVPATLISAVVADDQRTAEFILDIKDPAAAVIVSAYIATGTMTNLFLVDDEPKKVDKP